MLLKVGTQVSNAPKITLTKFHQHLSCGSQVFKGWHTQTHERLTTRSRLCYSPRRKLIVEDKNENKGSGNIWTFTAQKISIESHSKSIFLIFSMIHLTKCKYILYVFTHKMCSTKTKKQVNNDDPTKSKSIRKISYFLLPVECSQIITFVLVCGVSTLRSKYGGPCFVWLALAIGCFSWGWFMFNELFVSRASPFRVAAPEPQISPLRP